MVFKFLMKTGQVTLLPSGSGQSRLNPLNSPLCVSPQELLAMRMEMTGQINVEVDAAPQDDLSRVMSEIQYESSVTWSPGSRPR